jgi:hypothetical protein
MAITPNPSVEQYNKTALRGVTRGGTFPNVGQAPIDEAIMVNAAATTSGILELSVGTGVTTFTISGSNGTATTTLTGTSTGTQVSGLIAALAAGPLSGQTFYVNTGGANYLYNTTTSIIIPSGAYLTVVSGTGAVPTLTAFTLSGSLGTTYPNYVGTPNATPNWVDDATVHAYQVGFNGQLVVNNNGTLSGANVVQTQVRQIRTGGGPDAGSQTELYNGYFASYSGNLYQTGQKRTYRQQS